MEILNKFGFDIQLFAAQIVNFLVLAFLFKKFMYKPILKTLKDRRDIIKRSLQDSDNARIALEKAETTTDKIIKKAAKDAEEIIKEARSISEKTREEIINKTKEESERIMLETKKQIQQEREGFAKESEAIALEISRKILEQTITKLFDKKEQQALIAKGIKQIKSL